MLFPVEQTFVGRDEKRAPLKTPAWEAMNVTVSCNVLSRWAQLVSVFSRTDSDIQISKNGLHLKLKLH